MYKKIIKLSEIVLEVSKELNINLNNYSMDNIYKILMSEKLNDYLEITFKDYNIVYKGCLNSCNKFTYNLIEFYLEINAIKLLENKCGYQNKELKDYSIRNWTCPKCK